MANNAEDIENNMVCMKLKFSNLSVLMYSVMISQHLSCALQGAL